MRSEEQIEQHEHPQPECLREDKSIFTKWLDVGLDYVSHILT